MSVILLAIIYIIFISLGLPDTLIGSSWPSISASLSIDVSTQGILTFTCSLCTIISSFLTIKIVKLISEKRTIILSIFLTVSGLIIIGFSQSFVYLCLAMIVLGFGGGAIDSTLNNYVSLHYKALHLNWLHAFWGVGAFLSPVILSIFLTDINGWRNGAFCLAIIQSCIFLITLSSVKLWDFVQFNEKREVEAKTKNEIGFFKTFKIKNVIWAIIGFYSYIAIEQTIGLWASSMASFSLEFSKNDAALWTSLYYGGIMGGRFLSGFISLKLDDKKLIRIGETIIILGIILLGFSILEKYLMPVSLIIIGLGAAPIYPAIIHSTPRRFSKELSQNVMSVQVGCAYIANITAAPLFGIIASKTTFNILPLFVGIFSLLLIFSNEVVDKKVPNFNKNPVNL